MGESCAASESTIELAENVWGQSASKYAWVKPEKCSNVPRRCEAEYCDCDSGVRSSFGRSGIGRIFVMSFMLCLPVIHSLSGDELHSFCALLCSGISTDTSRAHDVPWERPGFMGGGSSQHS